MSGELPAALRAGIEALAANLAGRELAAASRRLSDDYRAGRGTRLASAAEVAAYAVARMPATFAACARALEEAAGRADFAPRSILDLGCGPGTATWAAAEAFPSLESARLVDAHRGMMATGRTLAAGGPPVLVEAEWLESPLAGGPAGSLRADLVMASYALNESPAAEAGRLAAALFARSDGLLVIVEPGTPQGSAVIAAARTAILAAGGGILAPCPGDVPCPVAPPDWCHFSTRLPRLRAHKAAKSADLPFEDEPFAYLVAARPGIAIRPAAARILRPPRVEKGGTAFTLCAPEGKAVRTVPAREREAHRAVRRLGWGDAFPADL